MISNDIYAGVLKAVGDALALEDDEVTPDATLLGDLGAESIDLLDILFRIERNTGVKVQAAELADYVQGGIEDEEFGDENEIITERGLTQLKRVMPQIDVAELEGNLRAEDVMSFFTVENLAAMIVAHAPASAA